MITAWSRMVPTAALSTEHSSRRAGGQPISAQSVSSTLPALPPIHPLSRHFPRTQHGDPPPSEQPPLQRPIRLSHACAHGTGGRGWLLREGGAFKTQPAAYSPAMRSHPSRCQTPGVKPAHSALCCLTHSVMPKHSAYLLGDKLPFEDAHSICT